MMKHLGILLAACLTACTTTLPTPAPLATPLIWQVQGTPALAWLAPALNNCAWQQADANLVYLERPTPALDSTAQVILRWGAPQDLASPSAILSQDELVFIVHPANPITQLSAADLRNLLTGKITTWEKLSPTAAKESIRVYTYAAGEDIQQVLESALPGLTVNRETGWLAPDPASVRQAVAASPLAMGYIPRRALDASVKVVPITDLPTASLRQPVLAITPTQPTEPLSLFLRCLVQSTR